MRKLLVGMVVLVSTVGGISACGNKTETKRNPQAAQTPAPSVDVQKAADVKAVETSDATVKGEPLPRFTLVLGEGKGGFKFRSTMLSDEAKAKIDEMFASEEVDLTNSHFEIEGYTDNLGTKEVNEQYGRARANAVKQYLGECHEIPASRIKVVSYGMEKPVGDNSTPEGRAQNRRVVIKVVD
ncbi:MAG TPA: OmpA family protein [Vicinamibacterales bacterium]|nr:OmpA family protein [Vicinamibacterales bacterium]